MKRVDNLAPFVQFKIYAIMKTMHPPGYQHNGFVANVFMIGYVLRSSSSMRFENSVCRGSLMTTYMYTQTHMYIYIYIYIL